MAVILGESIQRSGKTIILLLPDGPKRPVRRYVLCCIGNKGHYRKDGSCAHTAAVLTSLKSDYWRARTRVDGFGGRNWHQAPALQPPAPAAGA